MSATTIVVTNETSRKLSLTGDDGKPNVTISATGGSNYKSISMEDVVHNELLCSTLSTWITDGKVSVTRGGVTITAAQMAAMVEAMTVDIYDTDLDDIVDEAELLADDGFALAAINLKAVAETTGVLNGTAAQDFAFEYVIVHCTAVGGGLNGNVEITIGTSSGGTQVLSATPLTGLNTLNQTFQIALTGLFRPVAGNATLYVNVTSADTGAGTGTADVIIRGKLLN